MEQSGAQANAYTVDLISALIGEYFGNTAATDEKTIRENTALGSEGGFSEEDRTVRGEVVDYLLDKFSVIYLGLLVNESFRERFDEAVRFEMELTGKSRDYVLEMRKRYQGRLSEPSDYNVTLNFGTFSLALAKNVSVRIRTSMDKIAPFAEEFDSIVREVTDEEAAKIGFCVCNFMYLIRAFDKNPEFESYVRTVVHSVGSGLGIV